jgi:hypothetical protein
MLDDSVNAQAATVLVEAVVIISHPVVVPVAVTQVSEADDAVADVQVT